MSAQYELGVAASVGYLFRDIAQPIIDQLYRWGPSSVWYLDRIERCVEGLESVPARVRDADEIKYRVRYQFRTIKKLNRHLQNWAVAELHHTRHFDLDMHRNAHLKHRIDMLRTSYGSFSR